MKIQDKVFVVTGGGSGIGRALSLALLQRGARVAAVDIKEATLNETAQLANSAALSTHIVDISNKAQVEALLPQVIEKHGMVDGLVNNAGIIQPFVKLVDLDYPAIERVLNVNLYGTIYMLKTFLPTLLKRPEAHVVNISSMGGFFPFPGQTLYGASKAAVKILTEGLYAELIGTNVGVSVVFPGAIATNISQNSGLAMPETDAESAPIKPTSPEVAAETIITAIEKNKLQAYIGRDAAMMNIFYKLNPRGAIHFITKQMESLLPK
ncbi:MAG: SDR family oxidoreductase [Anaerolineales bacterium]|nr:MAG: SDR family oxidoreductase [Anaerolineales bacterium]